MSAVEGATIEVFELGVRERLMPRRPSFPNCEAKRLKARNDIPTAKVGFVCAPGANEFIDLRHGMNYDTASSVTFTLMVPHLA